MIGQIIGSLGGLEKSYIDAKTTVKITEAEIKKKQLTGEIDWEQQDTMARGFANLETTPLWVQWGMYASIAASFGIRTMRGLKK